MSHFGVPSPTRVAGPGPSSSSGSRHAPSPSKATTPNRIGVRTMKTPPTSAGLTLLAGDGGTVSSPSEIPSNYGRGTKQHWSSGPIDESVDDIGGSGSPTPSTTPVPVISDSVIAPGDISDAPPRAGIVHPHHRKGSSPTDSSNSYSDDDFESSSDEADTPPKGRQQPVTGLGVGEVIPAGGDRSPSPPPGEPAQQHGGGRRNSRRHSGSEPATAGGAPPPTRAQIVQDDGTPQEKPKKPPALQVNMGQKQLIGRGSFGDVYKAVDMLTNKFVAVKEIVLVEDDTKDLKKQIHAVEREMRVMQKLDHPNIVNYLGAKRKGTTLYLYTEFIPGGTISDFVRQYGPCNELQAARFMKQLLTGLDYLHGKSLVHRDLKGENLFLDQNGGLKLGDFGTSKELKTLRITNSVAGTPYFMAPEVINCSGHGFPADIWSVGCCLIQLLTGKPPFNECDNAFAIMFQVSKGEIESQMPKQCSDAAKDFIQNCVRMLPKERWTTQQLLRHPWLTTTLNEPRPKSATSTPPPAHEQKTPKPTTAPTNSVVPVATTTAQPKVTSPGIKSPGTPNSGAVDRLRNRVASGNTPPPVATGNGTALAGATASNGMPPRNGSASRTNNGKRSPPPPEVSNYQGRSGIGSGSGVKPGTKTSAKPGSSGSSGTTPLKRTTSSSGVGKTTPTSSKRPSGPK